MDPPEPATTTAAAADPMRSATMMGMSRQAYSHHAPLEASAAPSAEKIEASLKAVARFMTPEADSAPWLLRSLDHADAVRWFGNSFIWPLLRAVLLLCTVPGVRLVHSLTHRPFAGLDAKA